ncbi:hypothetical protein [Kitasatospora sp. McL0602]|uniref:hypothetical protein n=1 Tax=Kitasatospora sp. McL0602 TaxID=3439530 RepID=UPI003F8AE78F
MSDMQERFSDKADRDADDVRAADPEEGITSYQNAHAQDLQAAEGAPYEEQQPGRQQDTAR